MSEELLPRALPLSELLLAAGLVLQGCGGGGSGSPAPTPPTAEQLKATCLSLAGQVIEGVTITKTTRHEANAAVSSPGFCQVLGTRAPYLDIEIDVPDHWTGRYWQQGGGGFDGQIPSAVTTDAGGAITALSAIVANKGAVYAASNGGNRANVAAQAAPGIWASTSPEGRQSATDYAYAALGTTVHFGKAVTKAFFGKAPSHSYFNGCSNGGRNAYIAAQRWPQEFDGIVSGCETMDMAGQTSAWLQEAAAKGTPAALSAAQINAAHGAAVAACDGLDGVADEVIANPMACRFDPAALQCGAAGASPDPAICLSAPQVATMKSYFTDLKLQNGTSLLSGYWWSSGLGQGWELLGGGFALLASGDAVWLTPARQSTFQLETDYPILKTGLSQIGADHDKAAIAGFVASGRKLISWHGGSDGLLSPADHYRNWTAMAGIAQSKGLADPGTATRFFIVPGATHGVGQSLWEVDWASAIMDWVEKGAAPQQLIYTATSGTTTRSKPVCRHPLYPRYNGSGDVNQASSYTCS
ncbi:tannase/feruloyl esterase family alpha/beta hydrolase [Comamonas odontotermitis]|uniref:tannase/feruloyl esterase family alpha/beta hydrolase n=1 Tax=Comamonas odontotermitis TaxID=379895 RepID=UPI001CC34F2F|nr:tannase/feruloyl esterase family alpha/beta hydrolase [Comamonas odontotermitis]UBB18405.1 tannase/feruloyl esterase family alpha/beta hydrolase [Comamonas odontotermitis]